MDSFKYANVFHSYGACECEFDADLDNLVSCAIWRCEDNRDTEGDYYERVGDAWVEINAESQRQAFYKRREEADERRRSAAVEKPWRLWVFGPANSLAQWWASYATKEEAVAAAQKLPSCLLPTITNAQRRPSRPNKEDAI